MKKLISIFFIIFILFFLLPSNIFPQQYYTKRYSTFDGLLQNTIRSIIQDDFGRLWLGTSEGLSIYDGTDFTNYEQKDGLSGSVINCFFKYNATTMWVSVVGGSKFDYRLKQIDVDGNYKYSKVITVKVTPGQFSLNQNYPNPFNPSTVIRYAIPKDGYVTLIIYDILGRKVQTLVSKIQPAGRYKKTFNASALASGIYFYRISVTGGAGNFINIKKMILVK